MTFIHGCWKIFDKLCLCIIRTTNFSTSLSLRNDKIVRTLCKIFYGKFEQSAIMHLWSGSSFWKLWPRPDSLNHWLIDVLLQVLFLPKTTKTTLTPSFIAQGRCSGSALKWDFARKETDSLSLLPIVVGHLTNASSVLHYVAIVAGTTLLQCYCCQYSILAFLFPWFRWLMKPTNVHCVFLEPWSMV